MWYTLLLQGPLWNPNLCDCGQGGRERPLRRLPQKTRIGMMDLVGKKCWIKNVLVVKMTREHLCVNRCGVLLRLIYSHLITRNWQPWPWGLTQELNLRLYTCSASCLLLLGLWDSFNLKKCCLWLCATLTPCLPLHIAASSTWGTGAIKMCLTHSWRS